ncbi:MAG TPA: hypothetical protein VM012_04410, partial [Flavitalea sp.]|nr:hypothetical protein [Flavitalea sp.]
MRKLLFILFVLCIHIKSVSQKEANNWYFGNRAAITFKNGSPAVISDSRMVTPEGCATVSDKNGRLLFYTNGVTVFNSINEVMENGDNLAGHISSTQSSLIVPIPENDSLYYIFTVDFHGGAKGLNYSVVNIVLNNGLGKVVRKNIKLFSPITEKISAVHHCNNKDIWVTVRAWNSDLYWSYLIDKNGLSIDPVPSATGNIITGREFNTLGAMKIAP